MQDMSRHVWNDLQDSTIYGTPYHEDTITQSMALQLSRHHPSNNRVHVLGRNAESRNGSDFIWLIFDDSMSHYVVIAIQAKKLFPEGEYTAFKAHQVTKIVNYAGAIGAIPLFLTYNSIPVLQNLKKSWRRQRRRWRISSLEYQRDLGLIYFHAQFAKNIKDGKLNARLVSKVGWPMWTLFCNCNQAASGRLLVNLREEVSVLIDGKDDPPSHVRKTTKFLRLWMSGKNVREEGLLEELKMLDVADDEGFVPSFILGSTSGSL